MLFVNQFLKAFYHNYKRLLAYIFVFLVSAFVIVISSDFLLTRLNNALVLSQTLFEYLKNGGVEGAMKIADSRRFYLFVANLGLLFENFPFGTGMGMDNYLNQLYASQSDLLRYTDHFGRAHNFYISYVAEAGFFFFGILYFLLKPLFSSHLNSTSRLFYLSLLIGLAFNEYVTSPFFWMMYGDLSYKAYNFHKLEDYENH